LGFRDNLEQLVKMGCQMSKQLQGKKLLSAGIKKRKPQSPSHMHELPVETKVDVSHTNGARTTMSTPVEACDISLDLSSVKVEIPSDDPIIHKALSCRTTDSGGSPSVGISCVTPPRKSTPKALFDDEVLSALAAVDAESRIREEQALQAVLRSISA
jgi:hypothetical protein